MVVAKKTKRLRKTKMLSGHTTVTDHSFAGLSLVSPGTVTFTLMVDESPIGTLGRGLTVRCGN